jgi:uncharacterized membrane protein YfcA
MVVMTWIEWLLVALIGAGVGFSAGLFGAGGSAVATPLLHALGIPAFAAVVSPLPAALPIAAAASRAYRGRGYLDRRVLVWGVAVGVPATVAGALLSPLVGGEPLVIASEALIVAVGLRLLLFGEAPREHAGAVRAVRFRMGAIALLVGLVSGLLANSGGFLLAPLFLIVLHLRVKQAFATSLAVSAVVAVPGTLAHWALGHIDWRVVAVLVATATPLSYAGARLALVMAPGWLRRMYGGFLALVGLVLLVWRLW